MRNDAIEDKIAAALSRLPAVYLCYLFGSRVTGQVGPMSDYDFGVLVDRRGNIPLLRA